MIRRLDKEVAQKVCGLPPPLIEDAKCRPCETPEEVICEILTDAKDTIFIANDEVQRGFKFTNLSADCGDSININKRIKMVWRKRGTTKPLQYITPYKLDSEGLVWFAWCDMKPGIWSLDPAQYEADVYFDGHKCAVLLFEITQCHVFLATTESVNAKCDVGKPNDDECLGVIPTLDVESNNPLSTNTCGVCDAKCN